MLDVGSGAGRRRARFPRRAVRSSRSALVRSQASRMRAGGDAALAEVSSCRERRLESGRACRSCRGEVEAVTEQDPMLDRTMPCGRKSKRPVILLVEDHGDVREICRTVLRNEGFHVVAARDGREGLQRAQRLRPDLIVMDLAMPAPDGLEVTRILKASAETASVPIIAVSAYDPSHARERAMAAGCQAFLPKPFEIDDLLGEVNRLIGRQREGQAAE